jgi:putative toxin-antitoxin system antitoxin component (TIGR02293 family)
MEKRRSSRKTEDPRTPAVHKGGPSESLPSAAEVSLYEILLRKDLNDVAGVVADLMDTDGKKRADIDKRRAGEVIVLRARGKTVEEIASLLKISKAEVEDSLRLGKRLLTERLKEKRFSFNVSQVVRVSEENVLLNQERILPSIIERATEVIGDREKAMRWLGTPVRGLDYATPISLLATEEGAERVNDILGQIEHGVW